MKIYQLSHTDLDGYACQYLMNYYFKNCIFFNANYGREISEKLELIKALINEDLKENEEEKILFLISDLNLSLVQCEDLQKEFINKNVKLLLLDHHASGAECAQKYDWYFLDSSRSASKIVFDFFSKDREKNEKLERLISVVNAIDIWKEEEEYFSIGKVFLEMIATARELNRLLFDEQNRAYIFELIKRASSFIDKENANIDLDNSLHFIKKDFFNKNSDDTLSNLVSKYIVKLLSENKEKYQLSYQNHKGILTMNIGNVSVIGNDFLKANPDFDFFIDLSSRKTMSFRANNKLDVSKMAKKLVGGGGHANASGGFFASFKDSFDYDTCKDQVIALIKLKE